MSSRTPDLSREQLEKAIVALLKYVGHQQEKSNSLLDEDDYVHLVCAAATVCAMLSMSGIPTGVLPLYADSSAGKDAYRATQRQARPNVSR